MNTLPTTTASSSAPQWSVLPRTMPGRWALGLLGAGVVLALVPNLIWGAGPPHTGSMLATAVGFLAVLVAAAISVVAVVRQGERSVVLLVVCFLLTLFVLTFLVGELFEGGG